MYRRQMILAISLGLIVSVALIGCAQEETPELTAKEDFDQTLEIYREAETHQEKVKLWFPFIKRHPGSEETARVVAYLARAHYLTENEDPRGAVDLVLEYREYAESDEIRARYDEIFFDLAGESGIDQALTADEWELIRTYGEETLTSLTPEKIREDAGEEELTDAEVADQLREKKEHAYQRVAIALVHLDRVAEGLARFEEGAEFVKETAAGFTYTEYPTNWAKTVLATGDPKRAVRIAAPRAVILGDEAALDVMKEAYLASGGSDAEFDTFVEETRRQIARPMPAFTAVDYTGETRTYDSFKGKVTLLAFWFPT